MIGRISADTPTHCATQVAKILGYERTPIEGDPNWPVSATLMICEDNDAGDWIYYMNTWLIYDLLDNAGYAPVDTLFTRNDVTRSQVYASVNAGKGFLNYRGQAWTDWLYPFDISADNTTSGWRLPVVVSATCATGIYDLDGFACEKWMRAGNVWNPKGCAAYFATSTAFPASQELSLRRGHVDEGFFENIFEDEGRTLGEACLAGKMKLYLKCDDQVDYEGWNLLGDPEMNLWTDTPFPLSVLHDEGTQIGESEFVVTVMAEGSFLEDALVTCAKDDEVYSLDYTDEFGQASLSISPTTSGALTVTVTARNAVPYEGTALVLESGPFISYSALSIDDSTGGNGDGYLNPGESVEVAVALTNIGNEEAETVAAILRTIEPHTTVTDSTAAYGSIQPDSTSWGQDTFEIVVSPDCPTGTLIPLSLSVSYSGSDGSVLNPPPVEVVTGHLAYSATECDDHTPGGNDDGLPGAGETVALSVFIVNDGPSDLATIQGTLWTTDASVVVTSAHAAFADAPAGQTCDNQEVPFIISVSPTALSGYHVPLSLAITADGGTYQYSDTVELEIVLTASSLGAPTGPDAYGYYAYDQADSAYGPAPTFEWTDIVPPGPGTIITEITDDDAAVTTKPIIFGLRYYGETHGQISINSNGFLTAGWTDYRFGDNSRIPDTHGPPNMIAPFWDDLDPSAGGDIYYWLDVANHRYIVQFDEVLRHGTTEAETFQVIFLNETYYPTPTDDTMILIQYKDVSNPLQCTVGIENEDQTDGIEWLYDGAYGPQAGPVADSTAILFTTITPEEPDVTWLVLDGTVVDDNAGGNGDGIAQPGETISLSIGLANEGGSDATDISLLLSSRESTISVSDSTALVPDIPAGSWAQSTDPFVFTVSETIGDTVATLWARIDANEGTYSGAARIDLHIDLSATGAADEPETAIFRFRPCYPNPFTLDTTMHLTLPATEPVTVRIYNPAGRLVTTLVDAPLAAGRHLIRWDGTDGTGNRVASGVYFVRLEAGPDEALRKVVLLR